MEREPGSDDRLVLLLHRLPDRLDVLLVGGEVAVALERRHEPWGCSVEERIAGRQPGGVDGRPQVGEVCLQVGLPDVGDRPHARLALEGLRSPGGGRQPPPQLVVRGEVECRLARRVTVEPGQAVLDVRAVRDLRELPVGDNVDAGLDLASHDRPDRVGDRGIECVARSAADPSPCSSRASNCVVTAAGRGSDPTCVVRIGFPIPPSSSRVSEDEGERRPCLRTERPYSSATIVIVAVLVDCLKIADPEMTSVKTTEKTSSGSMAASPRMLIETVRLVVQRGS